MIKTGIFGASGYTGFEVVKILDRHPGVEISFATSFSSAGRQLPELYPTGPEIMLVDPEAASLDEPDVVFLCLPHGTAAALVVKALEAGVRVIDLSADFRLTDAGTYARWYDQEHPTPQLLPEAVYGLTEFARQALPQARLVANPGCYPTSILLALQPVIQAGAVTGTIIADSKSGVSGAGRTPKQGSHFVEVAGNFSPYKIGQSHRHLPEIEQGLAGWDDHPPQLIFSPHLLPVPRGILSTIYVPLAKDWSEQAVREIYLETYEEEPFVKLLPAGEVATLAHAVYTNRCVIGMTVAANTLIITSAIDNLLKGAAGQAVQNMNAMFGLDETTGLVA